MDLLNMVEKISDITTIFKSGLSTLHIMPRELLAYLRLISLAVSSLITNKYCLTSSFRRRNFFVLLRLRLCPTFT